jgi:hypothetical protein
LGDTKGFPGFLQMYDSANMEVDAGGDSEKTSVYAARLGERECTLVFGSDSTFALDEWRVETRTNTPSYVNDLNAWLGLQIHSVQALGRIKNIENDDDTLTDSMIADLVQKFPAGKPPTHLFMNTRSRMQLQKSRSAISNIASDATGRAAFPPLPTESNGVPIITTDGLVNTES